MTEQEHGPGEPGEEHEAEHGLPTSTIYPFGFAAGVAVLLIGLVLNWVIVAVGAGIAIAFGFLWARLATREYTGKTAPPPPSRAEVETVETVEEEVEVAEEPERYGRNVFLERSTLALGALIGIGITVPVVGFAIAPAFIGQDDENVDLGPLENYPQGEWRVATFVSKPETQGPVSTQTAFVRYNGLANSVPSFTILSNRCVHLGCPTQPGGPTEIDSPQEVETANGQVRLIKTQPSNFICPCHGGSYDTEGNRVAGPPVRSLDRYTFAVIDGRLVLGERYSVGSVTGTGADAQIDAYLRFDPGQHVDGPEAWLYPITPHGGWGPPPSGPTGDAFR